MLVAPEPPFEADRDRPCPDEQEHRICSYLLCILAPLAPEDDAPQVGVTASFGDLGGRSNRDAWMLVDPFDQVVGHPSVEVCPAYDDGHRSCVLGQMNCRLAGGVTATDNHHIAALQSNCFRRRGAVMDSCANELSNSWRFKSPVVHAGGDDTGLNLKFRTAGQLDSKRAVIGRARCDELCSHKDLRPKTGCLSVDARREFCSTDPLREAWIVFDPSACASLTSRRDRFHHDCADSFRCTVESRGESSGACTDDEDVVHLCRRSSR